MCRSEAKGVPSLLVAPKENGVGEDEVVGTAATADEKGYYANGAYTAKPRADAVTGTAVSREILEGQSDPQESYRQRLLLRFKLLRANLRISPPAKAVAELDDDHPTGFSGNQPIYKRAWKNLLLHTEPLPAQLAVMDTADVFRLLRIVTGMLRRNINVPPTASRWIWALLARIEDLGCLSNDDVSVVRELGKRAVWVSVGVESGRDAYDDEEGEEVAEVDVDEMEPVSTTERETAGDVEQRQDNASQLPEVASSQPDRRADDNNVNNSKNNRNGALSDQTEQHTIPQQAPPSDVDSVSVSMISDSSEEAEQRAAATAAAAAAEAGELTKAVLEEEEEGEEGKVRDDPFPSPNTLATLDMIITIAGEIFGQRDLLEYQEVWG